MNVPGELPATDQLHDDHGQTLVRSVFQSFGASPVLGWVSSLSLVQHCEYAFDNTLEEQAQYTVRAYEILTTQRRFPHAL